MSDFDLKNVAAQFCVGEYVSCERYGEGHINDTYKLTVREGGREKPYILQRINNRLFTDVPALMRNIELVTDFCRRSVEARGGDPMRECLNLVRTRDGKNCYTDGENWFRVYVFIENATTYQIVRDPRDFYESAVAFGSFANLLAGFDASQLTEVLPDFHNTRVRYANFLRSVEKDACGRRREVEKEIAWVNARRELCGAIVDKIASGEIPLRVTHNDTKLNNVMIDDKTGRGARRHRPGYRHARLAVLRLRGQHPLRLQPRGGGRTRPVESQFPLRPLRDLSARLSLCGGRRHHGGGACDAADGRGAHDL